MGQQQLLLIILGVIVVGIAVAVGITMFNDSAVSANRDAVTNDLVNLASRAQQYYRRPTALGGGGGSFATLSGTGMSLLTKTSGTTMVNGNGTYEIVSASASTIQFRGVGTETGNDPAGGVNGKVTVVMNVWADSAKVDVASTN
jgi:Tfp pilus assembly protein PilE